MSIKRSTHFLAHHIQLKFICVRVYPLCPLFKRHFCFVALIICVFNYVTVFCSYSLFLLFFFIHLRLSYCFAETAHVECEMTSMEWCVFFSFWWQKWWWSYILSVWCIWISQIRSFLNSCVNPVALYCVSGVFRQHFHQYLCCKHIQQTHHRLGMSMATNACDTSFMSTIRRTQHGNHHTIVHNGSSPTQSIIMNEKRWGKIMSQDTFL